MKKGAFILILFFAFTGCKLIERWKLKANDIEIVEGVYVSLIDDYHYDDLPNRVLYSSLRIFVSDGAYFGDTRFYYIFWNDGRCFYSSSRKSDEISIQNILNDKRGTAGFYKIIDGVVWVEFYSNGTFYYNYFNNAESELMEIGQKGRKPFKNKMRDYASPYLINFEEQFTTPTSDSLYFNNDSIAIWEPFW